MYYNDDALIQSCLSGDESAWKELVSRYGRLVYCIPRRYGLSDAAADDVFQNVFTIVLRKLSTLRNTKTLASWLITITYRESWRLKKLNGSSAELDETFEDDGTPPHDQVQIWERQFMVRQALGKLDSTCRELLTALFLESGEPSYEKVAKRLGMAVGSIGPTRARCFKKLEGILLEMGIDVD